MDDKAPKLTATLKEVVEIKELECMFIRLKGLGQFSFCGWFRLGILIEIKLGELQFGYEFGWVGQLGCTLKSRVIEKLRVDTWVIG